MNLKIVHLNLETPGVLLGSWRGEGDFEEVAAVRSLKRRA